MDQREKASAKLHFFMTISPKLNLHLGTLDCKTHV